MVNYWREIIEFFKITRPIAKEKTKKERLRVVSRVLLRKEFAILLLTTGDVG